MDTWVKAMVCGVGASLLVVIWLPPWFGGALDGPCPASWRVVLIVATAILAGVILVVGAYRKERTGRQQAEAVAALVEEEAGNLELREAEMARKEASWSALVRTADLPSIARVLREKERQFAYFAEMKLIADSIAPGALVVTGAVPGPEQATLTFTAPQDLGRSLVNTWVDVYCAGQLVGRGVVTAEPSCGASGACVVPLSYASEQWTASLQARYLFQPVTLADTYLVPWIHPELAEADADIIRWEAEAIGRAAGALESVLEEPDDTWESDSDTE